MKITYDHYYGQQKNNSIQLYNVNLQCEPQEEAEALANGWLLYNQQWYQSRSTRINLELWKPNYQSHSCKINFLSDGYNLEKYKDIWHIYITNKNYPQIYNPFTSSNRDCYMEYYVNDELVGFTKFIKYNDGLESQFIAYISHPTQKYGLDMLNFEVNCAVQLGLNYLYIGSGYERSSIYKAHLDGFEWWTGSYWSQDKQMYIDLCNRDSRITTIKELCEIAEQ
jgi:hypothetical protein